MYSTKLLNKNMVSNNAYITIGDPYADPNANPFRAPKKGEKAPNPFRTKGIPQNAENGNFAKLTYVAEGFKEGNKYITTQPLDSRKKGFGSKDASRRDEFANNIRTEQYRETLFKEKLMSSETPEVINERLTQLLAERAKADSTMTTTVGSKTRQLTLSQHVHQYDIGRTRTTDFDPKSTKDFYYRFDGDNGKYFGELPAPVSYEVGDGAWNSHYRPPQHGGKSEVKNFYDKSHLNVKSY